MVNQLNVIEAILLGIVQGITEWLPISSSAHLVIMQTIFGIDAIPAFHIIIMLGSVFALIIYFRHRFVLIFRDVIDNRQEGMLYIKNILICGLATAIIGFAGRDLFTSLFMQPIIVGILLMVNGFFLYIASKFEKKINEIKSNSNNKQLHQISSEKAFLIGIAQGLAVAPGISRSGSTIATGIIIGLEKTKAAEFSFIVGIPTMLVAALFELLDLIALANIDSNEFFNQLFENISIFHIVIGTISAFVSGYVSVDFFMKFINKHGLQTFAYYCIILGFLFVIFCIKSMLPF